MKKFDIEKEEHFFPKLPEDYFEKMQASVLEKITQPESQKSIRATRKKNFSVVWAVAASLVLFVGLYRVFQTQKTTAPQATIAINHEDPNKKIMNKEILNKEKTDDKTQVFMDRENLPKENPVIKKTPVKQMAKRGYSSQKTQKINPISPPEKQLIQLNSINPIDELLTSFSDEEIDLLNVDYGENLFTISEY